MEIHIDVYNMHCSCKDIKTSESRSVKWAEIVPDECTVFSWKTKEEDCYEDLALM